MGVLFFKGFYDGWFHTWRGMPVAKDRCTMVVSRGTTSGQRHSHQSDCVTSRMYACVSVTGHLHFWQNDWGLLHATAVTQGWNGHQKIKSAHKVNSGKKILLPLLPGFELTTFRSQVWCSYQQAIPAPQDIQHHPNITVRCWKIYIACELLDVMLLDVAWCT